MGHLSPVAFGGGIEPRIEIKPRSAGVYSLNLKTRTTRPREMSSLHLSFSWLLVRGGGLVLQRKGKSAASRLEQLGTGGVPGFLFCCRVGVGGLVLTGHL